MNEEGNDERTLHDAKYMSFHEKKSWFTFILIVLKELSNCVLDEREKGSNGESVKMASGDETTTAAARYDH